MQKCLERILTQQVHREKKFRARFAGLLMEMAIHFGIVSFHPWFGSGKILNVHLCLHAIVAIGPGA